MPQFYQIQEEIFRNSLFRPPLSAFFSTGLAEPFTLSVIEWVRKPDFRVFFIYAKIEV